MNFSDYTSDVYSAAMEVIWEDYKEYNNWEKFYNELWLAATGSDYDTSYYCDSEGIGDSVFDLEQDDEYLNRFGPLPTYKGAEECNVIVRCHVLDDIAEMLQEEFERLKTKEKGEEYEQE